MQNYKFNIDLVAMMNGEKFKTPDFKKAIETGIRKGFKELEKLTVDKLMENLMLEGLGSSKIVGSLKVVSDDNGFSISLDGGYAVYLEFGTGIVGQGSSHTQHGEFGWVYDSKGHGHSGWWYPSSPNDPNPTAYMNIETGEWWAWTKGQKSKPFMYKTWKWAKDNSARIVNESIGKELEKLQRRSR